MEVQKETLDENGLSTDLELSTIEDSTQRHRRLVSKILSAANVIAKEGRKGPANYVFLHKNHGLSGEIGGIPVKDSQNEGIIIVGRHNIEAPEKDLHIQIKLT